MAKSLRSLRRPATTGRTGQPRPRDPFRDLFRDPRTDPDPEVTDEFGNEWRPDFSGRFSGHPRLRNLPDEEISQTPKPKVSREPTAQNKARWRHAWKNQWDPKEKTKPVPPAYVPRNKPPGPPDLPPQPWPTIPPEDIPERPEFEDPFEETPETKEEEEKPRKRDRPDDEIPECAETKLESIIYNIPMCHMEHAIQIETKKLPKVLTRQTYRASRFRNNSLKAYSPRRGNYTSRKRSQLRQSSQGQPFAMHRGPGRGSRVRRYQYRRRSSIF